MFQTYPHFKYPMQFSDTCTIWSAVELTDTRPWFLATILHSREKVKSHFMLGRTDEILWLAEEPSDGELVALHLVQSAEWSKTGDWEFVQIKHVDRDHGSEGEMPHAVVTDANGIQYGGYPIAKLTHRPNKLERVVDLQIGKKSH